MSCYASGSYDAAVLTVADIGNGRLATGGGGFKINAWNVAGEKLATIPAHTGWV